MPLRLHVHVARITADGKKRLRPELDPHPLLRFLTPAHTSVDGEDESRAFLLCLTGDINRPFMQRWTQALDSCFGSFWRDATTYDTKAVLILAWGYLCICLPLTLTSGYILNLPELLLHATPTANAAPTANANTANANTTPTANNANNNTDGCGPPVGSVLVLLLLLFSISLLFFRGFWHMACKHHYFSAVENGFAFNVNSQVASFFKQYRVRSMKPYADRVPTITLARLFVDTHQVTFTMLCYHVPLELSLLIPTACEAIDTLRAKRKSKIFINMIVCVAPDDSSPPTMTTLLDFFTASGFLAILSPDASMLVCVWGLKGAHITMHTLAQDVDNAYYMLLSLVLDLDVNAVDPDATFYYGPPKNNSSDDLLSGRYENADEVAARPILRRIAGLPSLLEISPSCVHRNAPFIMRCRYYPPLPKRHSLYQWWCARAFSWFNSRPPAYYHAFNECHHQQIATNMLYA